MSGHPEKPPGFAQALAAAGEMFHDIPSRTDAAQLAAEVVRLNDAVRRASAGRAGPYDQPADFAALLLANADPINQGPGR